MFSGETDPPHPLGGTLTPTALLFGADRRPLAPGVGLGGGLEARSYARHRDYEDELARRALSLPELVKEHGSGVKSRGTQVWTQVFWL